MYMIEAHNWDGIIDGSSGNGESSTRQFLDQQEWLVERIYKHEEVLGIGTPEGGGGDNKSKH